MANIRIAQQLSSGYNPDGTPGTVSTGLQGPPGPPATDAQVAAAVAQYIQSHYGSGGSTPLYKTTTTNQTVTTSGDIVVGGGGGLGGSGGGTTTKTYTVTSTKVSGQASLGSTATLTTFGVGADGSQGAWVALGDGSSTVSGYIVAGGPMPNVDLHLVAQGKGQIYLDSSVAGDFDVDSMTVRTQLVIGAPDANTTGGQILFEDTVAGNITVATANLGNSAFDNGSGQGWILSNDWVQFYPYGGQGNPVGMSAWDILNNTYAPIHASAFVVGSDRRWKSDIVELSGALEEVRTTKAYSYEMSGQRRRGLIADEAPAAVVRTDEDGYGLIEAYDLVGTLWAAVRELADKIEGMEQTCRCQPTE